MIHFLPIVDATLNAASAVLLVCGFYFIRRKNIPAHRACMLSAFGTSVLFLICYLTYHYFHGVTRFPGHGFVRTFYLSLLGSHTILAVVIVPLDPNHVISRLAPAFRPAPQHRRLGAPPVALCFRHWSGGILDALPDAVQLAAIRCEAESSDILSYRPANGHAGGRHPTSTPRFQNSSSQTSTLKSASSIFGKR